MFRMDDGNFLPYETIEQYGMMTHLWKRDYLVA